LPDIPEIDADVSRAHTLPGWFYGDPEIHAAVREKIFARCWHPLPAELSTQKECGVHPFTLLPGLLDEPLVATRDSEGTQRVLSNVCTHRASLVALGAKPCESLRCGYHGRRFALDGRCMSMPEFEGVEGFPGPSDHLPRMPLERLGPIAFGSASQPPPFDEWIAPILSRVGFLPLDELRYDAATSRTYSFEANWALYCDNYLEGFHIPFVHPELNRTLDFASYRVETLPQGVLQVAVASEGELCFELGADHPDADTRVAAFYFWLFPSTTLNFYPWGLSLNAIEPAGPTSTRVRFESWVLDESKRAGGAGGALDLVEIQDEEVVMQTQKGVRARAYDRGRYSPSQEAGVHHFHRLLTDALRV
jgi:choline monooxygenase